jgi:hypothetical protein
MCEVRTISVSLFRRWVFALPFGIFLFASVLFHSKRWRYFAPNHGCDAVGAQLGTEVELRLTGSRLDDTQELVFYEPGIQVVRIDSAKTNVVKAQLKIAADCKLV